MRNLPILLLYDIFAHRMTSLNFLIESDMPNNLFVKNKKRSNLYSSILKDLFKSALFQTYKTYQTGPRLIALDCHTITFCNLKEDLDISS